MGSPSKVADPGMQRTSHRPFTHCWVLPQATPQAPQWALDARVSTSHPLLGSLSQLANPEEHEATAQRPLLQAAVALERLQAAPHAPQFEADALRFASQPLADIESQSPKPALQRNPQALMAHVVAALLRGSHAAPQDPQWPVSLAVLTHALEHTVSPVAQVSLHAPRSQTCPPAHALLHAPQCELSLSRSRHASAHTV